MKNRYIWTLAITLIGLFVPAGHSLLGIHSVWAQTDACTATPSPEQLTMANKLAATGNTFKNRGQFDDAAQSYVEALQHARDPKLALAAGSAFFHALRLVEAYTYLDEAQRCGQGALKTSQLDEVERKLARLRTRLGQVTVDCQSTGAQVAFNDEEWFTCPGRESRWAVAGKYMVKVTSDGYFAVDKWISISPGQRITVEPNMLSIADGTEVTRPVPRWQPWALAGLGVVALGIGSGLGWSSFVRMTDSDDELSTLCPSRCDSQVVASALAAQERAITENRTGLALLALGGAALGLGVTALFFNRPRSRISPRAGTADVRTEAVSSAPLRVVPMAARRAGGLALRVNF